ncbi:MAG: hypothetical protein IJ179_06210 [Oscillospiraceae bacterium]|nr:hypothetical protein [Oscillospiraceae bacterium]
MTGLYRIAETNIEIVSLHAQVQDLCRDYRTEGAPELRVRVAAADIARERTMDGAAGYSDAYLETLAVYRQIAEAMPARGGLLLHGSALEVDGLGYLFTAPSGTGKSTHARLWRELLGARVRMINDDKPLLRLGPEGVTVYGTPWNGKHRLGENIAAPLRAVCFLEQAAENVIAPLSGAEVWPLLLAQVYRPADPAALRRTLELLDGLCARLRFYRLGCNMAPEAARLAYETMSKEETP